MKSNGKEDETLDILIVKLNENCKTSFLKLCLCVCLVSAKRKERRAKDRKFLSFVEFISTPEFAYLDDISLLFYNCCC